MTPNRNMIIYLLCTLDKITALHQNWNWLKLTFARKNKFAFLQLLELGRSHIGISQVATSQGWLIFMSCLWLVTTTALLAGCSVMVTCGGGSAVRTLLLRHTVWRRESLTNTDDLYFGPHTDWSRMLWLGGRAKPLWPRSRRNEPTGW